jgi:hypothetical protein
VGAGRDGLLATEAQQLRRRPLPLAGCWPKRCGGCGGSRDMRLARGLTRMGIIP